MKDRCKLFCRVAGSTAYYQLRDRVTDGTPCGPDTNDICVQGLCRVGFATSYSEPRKPKPRAFCSLGFGALDRGLTLVLANAGGRILVVMKKSHFHVVQRSISIGLL